MANKFTPQAEKIVSASLQAVWVGAGALPDSATVGVSFTRKLVNDDDPTNVIEQSNGAISFDALRADRSVQVGAGPSLTYAQVTAYYLKMVGDARANP